MFSDCHEWKGKDSVSLLVYTHACITRPVFSLQRWLRCADVRILRQLVAVHEGIEAMRWLIEERGILTSRCSSSSGSLSSLVTIEEHAPSTSACRCVTPKKLRFYAIIWIWGHLDEHAMLILLKRSRLLHSSCFRFHVGHRKLDVPQISSQTGTTKLLEPLMIRQKVF